MSCEGWVGSKLSDIIDFDPKETLKKGVVTKKVAMENVQPFTRKISGSTLEPYNGGSKFRDGDTILARITPCLENGKTALVSDLGGGLYFGSTEFIVMRAKKGKADWKYVYYLAMSQAVRDVAIKSMVGTSGRQRAQKDVIENFVTNLPPLPEQRAIAQILSSLDDKIELNNSMNKTLEEMAQTIFKRWFVDFEFPDENGNPYKSSNGKMVESELGMIPEGWRFEKLSKVTSRIVKKNNPVICDNTVTISAIDGIINSYFKKNVASADLRKYTIIRKGDFGYNRSLSVGYPVGAIRRLSKYDIAAVSPIYLCFKANNQEIAIYLDFYFKQTFFEAELSKIVHMGSRGHGMLNYNVEEFFQLQTLVPTGSIMKRFVDLYHSYNDLVLNIIEEISILTQLRDTLLPKLMSGEIRVPVMEETK